MFLNAKIKDIMTHSWAKWRSVHALQRLNIRQETFREKNNKSTFHGVDLNWKDLLIWKDICEKLRKGPKSNEKNILFQRGKI